MVNIIIVPKILTVTSAHGDTFRSAIWKACKNWYAEISDLSTTGHVAMTAWCLSVLVMPQTQYHHGSWPTDDLNLYRISQVTCSCSSLQTQTSWF